MEKNLRRKYMCLHAKLHPTFCDPMDCNHRVTNSSVNRISQARILGGLPFLPPGVLPDPGIEHTYLMSPALGGGFVLFCFVLFNPLALPGKPIDVCACVCVCVCVCN